jgi:hypothetical protein
MANIDGGGTSGSGLSEQAARPAKATNAFCEPRIIGREHQD